MFQTVVYHGDNLLGEVEVYPQQTNNLNSNLDPNSSKVIAVLDHLMREKRIRVTKFSPPSDRCPPLAVLYTIATSGLCMKLESNIKSQSPEATTALCTLHSTCLRENKTAVVVFGEGELHLVAMPTRRNDGTPCFWGFAVTTGIYDSCLVMLNLRCLGIVFDLDETLVVANTMRSFEDRIDSLQRKVNMETDPQRIAGMLAEMKRYQEDKALLKQYVESDQVIDNEKVFKVQNELIPALSDNHQPIVRPLIRLQDKNIVLTRINPLVRDTSVLVRMRPAWEDLRAYLTARGRKRFEVYVCTMAERDYALEMWRLLDPDSNLIATKQLLDRIVCVKSGYKKSLFNVFHDGSCHPKMSLVVDDRLKVWDESDQSRVHVVPAFAPYYAPQAEANNAIPVLCMARNVACNVRGAFFKEFDDSLLQQISRILYEDDLKDFLSPPDVSNYLISEDLTSLPNENREPICFDGMADAEVEKRLKEAISSSAIASAVASLCPNPDRNIPSSLQFPAAASLCPNPDPNIASSLQFSVAGTRAPIPPPGPLGSIPPFSSSPFPPAIHASRPPAHVGNADINPQGSPVREEGEVPESELDPDTRARLLILQHGQDTSAEPPFPARPLAQPPIPGSGPVPVHGAVPVSSPSPPPPPMQPGPRLQSRGSWFEDHVPPGQHGRAVAKEFFMNSEGSHFERQRLPPPYSRKMDGFIRSDRPFVQKQRFSREGSRRDDRFRSNIPFRGDDVSASRTSSSNRDLESGSGRAFSSNKDWDSDSGRSSSGYKDSESEAGQGISWSDTPAGALRDIAKRCGVKVEYKSALAASTELKFVMEVTFAGEKIGEGTGKTRREAQNHAAEASLMSLADKYLAHQKSESSPARTDPSKALGTNGSGSLSDSKSHGNQPPMHEDHIHFAKPGEAAGYRDEDRESLDLTSDGSVKSASVTALEELCMMEGLGLDFKLQPAPSTDSIEKDEVYAQVEVDGQILGRGSGLTWDDAKLQAAEKALTSLKTTLGHSNQKRSASPRSFQGASKRMRPEFPRSTQRFPSRYPRNASPVP